MKRREFLGATATLAISAAAGPPAVQAAPGMTGAGGGEAAVALADRLLISHPRRASLAAIGEAYRQDGALEGMACPDCLPDAMQAFFRHLDLSEDRFREMTPDAIRRKVRTRTTKDFAEGRIVPIRGWLLGETEARLCAIAALRPT